MQTVSSQFHTASQGQIVPLDWKAFISFDKQFDEDVEFFTFDQSEFDGVDLLAPSDDNPISYWDYYRYLDYTDRVLTMEWTREIEFPYSVSAALADFSMNNFDDYFTPDSGSPIDQYIIPKRPVRLYAGYKNAETVQQFVGLTEKAPVRDENNKTVSFHCIDFLSVIFSLELNETIAMQDVTTDVVLAAIFTQFGLSPSSYSLAQGRNIIPFLFFEKGSNAGNAIRGLMQAEMGNLWIDEQGVIRFEQRLLPISDPVMSFDNGNTIDAVSLGEDNIINYVKITSDVREVQPYQVIFSNARESGAAATATSDAFIIPANSSRPYVVTLDDPCLTVDQPSLGEADKVSWFTAINLAGAAVTSNVSATGSTLNTNEYITFIQNNNAFPVQIDQMEVWGEPARITNTIQFKAKDQDSIDKYEEQVLDITNNFFGSISNCDSFARTILDAYSENDPEIEMIVKGDYSLQLGDIIDVDVRSFVGEYKVTAITNTLSPYQCKIRATHYTPRDWFTFDVDEFDGPAVLAP
jgi:hypothetical protein